ncbi:hypothetical protein [Sphingobium sp. LMC3-1-1.1]|uniref:hypothetical protein n=1 Tax=unclassified Sphingobium TaxID=2611147 RepID=UPI0034211C0C
MSARFWLFSCACAATALTGGYGLGLYATTSPRAALETPLPQAAMPQDSLSDPAGLTGPAVVDCKGCGPTLADRQMAADLANWNGSNDPDVRHDEARYDLGEAVPEPPQAGGASSVSLEGLDGGSGDGGPHGMKIAQAAGDRTSAEDAPADVAMSY